MCDFLLTKQKETTVVMASSTILATHTSDNYEWTIDNPNLLKSGNKISSPFFILKIGSNQKTIKCQVTYNYKLNTNNVFEDRLDFSVVKETNTAVRSQSIIIHSIKFKVSASYYLTPNVEPTILTLQSESALVADASHPLTLVISNAGEPFRVIFTLSAEVVEISNDQDKGNDDPTETEKSDISEALVELAADLQDLYLSKDYADITLRVGSAKIPAHRTILAARSKAFAAMLQNGIDEIDIRDMTEDVLKELLRYFYTGEVKELGLALDLVKVAKTSDITYLEDLCKEHLKKNMTVENCLEVLAVAYDFKIHDLTTATVEFVVGKINLVQRLNGWSNFIRGYPELTVEIVTRFSTVG